MSDTLPITTERHQRSDSRTFWKNPLVLVTSSLMIHFSWDPWPLVSFHNYVVSSFENTRWSVTPSIPDQIFSCGRGDRCLSRTALSAMNVPAVDFDCLLLDLRFTKLNHDMCIWTCFVFPSILFRISKSMDIVMLILELDKYNTFKTGIIRYCL